MRRPVVVNTAIPQPGQAERCAVAALYEPKLLGLINGWIMFRGFEGHAGDDGPIGYVQEWRCCVGEELYAGQNNPQKP